VMFVNDTRWTRHFLQTNKFWVV